MAEEKLQRRQLRGLVKLLSFIGLGLLLMPMLLSTGIFSSSSPSANGIPVETSSIQPGRYKVVEYAGREFWVYHWSEQDRQQFAVKDDKQAWTVMIPYEPFRGCQVHLQEKASPLQRFREPCLNAVFDVRGRHLRGSGESAQQDLPTFAYQWQDQHMLIQPAKALNKE